MVEGVSWSGGAGIIINGAGKSGTSSYSRPQVLVHPGPGIQTQLLHSLSNYQPARLSTLFFLPHGGGSRSLLDSGLSKEYSCPCTHVTKTEMLQNNTSLQEECFQGQVSAYSLLSEAFQRCLKHFNYVCRHTELHYKEP